MNPSCMFLAKAVSTGLCVIPLGCATGEDASRTEPLPVANSFRGIWYSNQPSRDVYRYKYSGGLATYPQQHVPVAYYSSRAGKTFFVWGGVSETGSLLHMVSYFDHATQRLARPRILLDKGTGDAHDNPTLMLDDRGYVWIFSNAHGRARPSYVHVSREPYSIDAFELVLRTNFSYSQPWHVPGVGWCFLHTRYGGGRRLYCWRSRDGRSWEDPQLLAKVERGHYQVSWRHRTKIGTAFNFHPTDGGLNARTNLYYMESADGGRTWTDVGGRVLELPLEDKRNPALVENWQERGKLVYLKDIQFDALGRPVILYLTSLGYRAGPASGPRIWYTTQWTGDSWATNEVIRSDHNYDFGSLYLERDRWRLIAPTEPGPQPWGAGGEIAVWVSMDRGRSWRQERQLTRNSDFNHTYVRRPVDAHPDFYALWADGHAREASPSRLYYATRDGSVTRMR